MKTVKADVHRAQGVAEGQAQPGRHCYDMSEDRDDIQWCLKNGPTRARR